jgi:hypothetical protein
MAMRSVIRWSVIVITTVHGLIHFMGAVKGFGWADVTELTEPIGPAMGVAWLVAGLSVLAAAALLAADHRHWWRASVLAAMLSQAVVVTSWSDARAGTAANALLLAAAVHGDAARGPRSLRTRYSQLSAESVAQAVTHDRHTGPLVQASELAHLPAPVADYVRASGAVGRPRVIGVKVRSHGRIRSGPDQPWMNWTGAQVNTFGPTPTRTFFMDATKAGLPIDVLHVYREGVATMDVRAMSMLPVIHSSGPPIDRAETVTVLNDLCVFAPAALVDAPIEWTAVDDRHARASWTVGLHTVSAELVFDDAARLVDFISDDRLRASANGHAFAPQRWSTPVADYRRADGRLAATTGRGRWHPTDEESFDYLELHVDSIEFVESDVVEPDATNEHDDASWRRRQSALN